MTVTGSRIHMLFSAIRCAAILLLGVSGSHEPHTPGSHVPSCNFIAGRFEESRTPYAGESCTQPSGDTCPRGNRGLMSQNQCLVGTKMGPNVKWGLTSQSHEGKMVPGDECPRVNKEIVSVSSVVRTEVLMSMSQCHEGEDCPRGE